MSPLLRHIAFLSESDTDRELFSSFIAVMGNRTGCRWVYRPDLTVEVLVIDCDDPVFFQRFCGHAHAVVVGYGHFSCRDAHYHLEKPLNIPALATVLSNIVQDGIGERDEVVRSYLADMNHDKVVLDVVLEVVQRLSSGALDKESVARQMGISSSTLQRRLAAEGASFRQLLNATRRDLAELYLREGRRPIKDVAYSLGFADLSNFTRAFRSWFGVSPREYRNSTRKLP
jgi:AraC-like DNA-binding protein